MRGKFAALLLLLSACAWAQQEDITGIIHGGLALPKLAIPDFRAADLPPAVMKAFNDTLWSELSGSGAVSLVNKVDYPLNVPQQPADFRPGAAALTDWSHPPTSATNLAFGYAAVQNGQMTVRGWLYNLSQPDPVRAQVIGKVYFGTMNADGAKKTARDFAADILLSFGVKSLEGTKIYFVSDRTGAKEIWSMDHDGSNQRQITRYKTITQSPVISPDGKWLAYTTLGTRPGAPIQNWDIVIQSTITGERAKFQNPDAATNGWPEFTSSGQFWFASSLTRYTEIYCSNQDGTNARQITHTRDFDFSPRVNPKNPTEVMFISARSGKQQLWRMNSDGSGAEMITNGTGEVANPAWSPDGQFLAFAWTRGVELGGFNINLTRISDRKMVQLTKDSGVNENPWFAPDNLHLVYSSKRGDVTQIYTMTLDGKNQRKLTGAGNNMQPVWTSGVQ